MSDATQTAVTGAPTSASPTIDDLFRRSVLRQPKAIALIDPPNKPRIAGQPALQLTYAEADRAVSAIAAKILDSGLPAGSIVAVQLPNTVEFPVAILAVIRAGMIAALVPQLWRQAELTAGLNRIGARAIIGIGRIELVDHAELALTAAADVFSIRHVFGFGSNLPDGMTPLDIDGAANGTPRTLPQIDPRRPAIISFDVTQDGLCVVPRAHVQLIAGGLALFLETGMKSGASILSTMAPCSFGGFSSSIMTWMLSGGPLALHHAGDLAVLERQIAASDADVLVVPAPLALPLAEAGAFSNSSSIRHVIGAWRAPETFASSDVWPTCNAKLTDLLLFGEVGLLAINRLEDGSSAPINAGIQRAPRAMSNAPIVGELQVTPKGKLAMQGIMVPVAAFQRPRQDDTASVEPYADTGYGARINRTTNTIDITAPPGGMIAVGGYKFRAQDLDEWSKRLGLDAMLAALPDQMNGHRLAGHSGDARRVREALGELGLNPLMVGAFRNKTDAA